MKNGADKLANAVKVTLGPKGRNVVLEKGYGSPIITNDGVTIAKDIELEDKAENIGAQIVKEAAEKTNDMAGDGTTTACVLAQALITEGLKNVAAGANPLAVKRGIDKGVKAVVEHLKTISKEISVTKKEEMAQVATISAESAELGNLIAEIMMEVGKDGVVTIEESKSFGIQKEIVKGLQFDRGYVSPYMITDTERMEAVLDDPYILVTSRKITSLPEILPLLEKVVQTGKKELVIIADDLEGDALTTLVVNKLRGILQVAAVKAPGYGDRRKEMMTDIGVLTGGKVFTKDLGIDLLIIKEKRRRREPPLSYLACIDAPEAPREIVYDPCGNFRIGIEDGLIVAVTGERAYRGRLWADVFAAIQQHGDVSLLDHAAYLGRELYKAELAIRFGRSFEQDGDF